jgi:hypothetical protein
MPDMGNLFDDDDEVPAHVPIPTSYPRFGHLVVSACVVGVLQEICPAYHQHLDHSLHRETAEGPMRLTTPAGAVGSTSGVTPFFGNTLDGANQVIHQHYAERDAWTQIASMMSSTSNDLLG